MARTPGERKRTGEGAAAPLTRHALLAEGARRLAAAGIENAHREAEWLLADVLGQPRAMLYARPGQAVPAPRAQTFRAGLRRRAGGEPLQYVLGHADFYGLRLAVTPDVLIPRPETEEVVAEALRRLAGAEQPAVLDVGTGSGCIALALKSERPDARVYACDVSRAALAVARRNADACALAGVHFFEADVLEDPLLEEAAFEALPAGLELLVSNPPYVPDAEAGALPPSVREHEPAAALFSGADALRFYRSLARHAQRLLTPGGHLVLEAHADHASAVAALLREHALQKPTVHTDAFGRDRIVTARQPPRLPGSA